MYPVVHSLMVCLLLSDMLTPLQVLLQELLVAAGAPAASGLPDVKRLACMHGLLQELLQHAAFGSLQVGRQGACAHCWRLQSFTCSVARSDVHCMRQLIAKPGLAQQGLSGALAEANLPVYAPCPWQGIRHFRGISIRLVLAVSALPLAVLTMGRCSRADGGDDGLQRRLHSSLPPQVHPTPAACGGEAAKLSGPGQISSRIC